MTDKAANVDQMSTVEGRANGRIQTLSSRQQEDSKEFSSHRAVSWEWVQQWPRVGGLQVGATRRNLLRCSETPAGEGALGS